MEEEYVHRPGRGASAAMAEVNVIADRLPDSSYLRLKVYTTWWVKSTLAYMLQTVTLCTYSSVLSKKSATRGPVMPTLLTSTDRSRSFRWSSYIFLKVAAS